MSEAKGFAGILDTDDLPSGVPDGFHMMAYNGRFVGVSNLLQYQNREGNRQITFVRPAGGNECIGSFYNPVDNILYWCNWNSNDDHAIYMIDMATEGVFTILQSGVNTDGDILNFTLNNPIHSMDLIYGSEGNTLCFVDSLGRPTEIDINRYLNNPYTLTKRAYIDVAKAPIIMPPKVSYENDEDALANNFRNTLWQFRCRSVCDSNEKPVYSSGSEVPLPYLPFDQTINKDATKNSRICVYVSTGDADIKSIEIIARKMQDGIVSDWVKIITLDKAELSIPDNSVYRYLFYNDSAYPTVPTEGTDPNTQVLNLQDYVPKQANTQALLNGDVPGYAGIVEGFDKVETNMNITTVASSDIRSNNVNGILFFASQSGLASVGTGNQIVIYLAGVGDNDNTTNDPITLSNSLNTKYYVRAQTTAGVDKSFFYAEAGANANIADILAGISTAAQAQGFTEVSLDANSLTLSLTDVVLLSSQIFTTEQASVNEAVYSNAPLATYSYAVEYFDEKGRTNGVMYGVSVDTTANPISTNLTALNIYHRPPLWATYYHVVRTKNTTYSKLLNWVSESAFSNKSNITNDVFAYIGLSNLVEYNKEISSTAGVVSYEFNKGDRIRFVARYDIAGTIDTTGFTNLDYEVLGTVTNPIVNGVLKEGIFVKIIYPTADISADFKFDGTDDFQNYHIQLYNNVDTAQKELEFFYEWAKQFGIGNAGTVDAFHAGELSTQTTDLVTPATILLDKGDWFSRYRNVVTINTYTAAGGNSYGDFYCTPRLTFPAEVTNSQYEIRNNDAHDASTSVLSYPTFADTDYLFYNKTAAGINVRIRATISVQADDETVVDVLIKQLGIIAAPGEFLTTVNSGIAFSAAQTKEITIDGVYYVCAGCKIWLLFGDSTNINNVDLQAFTLTLDVLKYTSIPIIEQSFWDLSYIDLNANSRVTVIDENAAEVYYPTKFRWGLAYQQDTNLNNINRFYPSNYDEWDRGKGDVRRLKVRERILKVFQSKGVGQVGIYTKFVQDSAGTQILTTTDDIIAKNNINYYEGEYGIGDYPTNLLSTDSFDGFVDPIRGLQIISDNSGLRSINELYWGQYYISGLLSNYNKTLTKPNGSRAKIMHVYNYVDKEWNCILEAGIADYNFSFNLKRNGYCSFHDWHPEWAASTEDKIVVWKNGGLWVHDNKETYCNYFGVQYDCNITMPFNINKIEKKGWKGLVLQSNVVWVCPEIYTQVISYGTTPQESNLIARDFRWKEGMFHASFLRDINSVKGINNGDRLKGSYMVVKFQPLDSSFFVFLTSISVKFLNSPLVPS